MFALIHVPNDIVLISDSLTVMLDETSRLGDISVLGVEVSCAGQSNQFITGLYLCPERK